jgi:RimJ/RimL family protein N-acetyltransferase
MVSIKTFISGENVNLCKPDKKFALKSEWYNWFNDPVNTKYLGDRGKKINTPQDQLNFFLSIKNRFILIIQDKKSKNFVGTVSLSNINNKTKTCDLAIVRDVKQNKLSTPLSSLESISLITEHAFEKMGIRIISAMQHIDLKKWQNQMELVGYKLEGLHTDRFYKFGKEEDSMTIACNIKDYKNLKKIRKKLWDGNQKMLKRYKQLIKMEKFLEKFTRFFEIEKKNYYKKIYEL